MLNAQRSTMIKVYVCLTILLSIFHGHNAANEKSPLDKTLKEMAEKGLRINDVFEPSKDDSFLGSGFFSFVHKGTLHCGTKRDVAMKFTSSESSEFAKREYEMYSYLNAINRPEIETYGIPAVYYYGQWVNNKEKYYLLAITLLDSVFYQKAKDREVSDVDLLILSRGFMRTIKYIHSRGVRHNDLKSDNIMFRGNQFFIIDFNKSSKMNMISQGSGCSALFSIFSKSALGDKRIDAKLDFGHFLHSLGSYLGVDFKRINRKSVKGMLVTTDRTVGKYVKEDLKEIEKLQGHDALKKILIDIIKFVFDGYLDRSKSKKTPQISIYDQFYKTISYEIKKAGVLEPALVSWLTNEQKDKAKHDIIAEISTIVDPFEIDLHNYPETDFEYYPRQCAVEDAILRRMNKNS